MFEMMTLKEYAWLAGNTVPFGLVELASKEDELNRCHWIAISQLTAES